MNLMLSQPRVELGLVTVMSSFDPPVVRPGEETIYRVTVTALEQSTRGAVTPLSESGSLTASR